MFSLKNLTALVTGATGGIGKAIAESFAQQGANLALSGTRESVLNDVCASIESMYNVKAYPLVCALNTKDDAEQLVSKAEAVLEKVDILVNNAGITRDGLIIRMKDEDWQDVIDINLTASFRLSRAAAKTMMKRRFGRIINISSVVGSTGNPGQTNYCASKAGLVGFSKALAHELATRGITVNCVAPGFVETAMTSTLPESVQTKILNGIPTRRMGFPHEIAAAVSFLASNEAGYITGQTLHVNGGMEMV
jgi:3-oxoacyl-[acyl-carrier protein] reductase